ncbi:hypothetical protein DMENIID0001_090490 [Sergentomyia squamirostris]
MRFVPLCILVIFTIVQIAENQTSAIKIAASEARYGNWSRWSVCDVNCRQQKTRVCLGGQCQPDRLTKERKCPECSIKWNIVKKFLNFFGMDDSSESDYVGDDSSEYFLPSETLPTAREADPADPTSVFNNFRLDSFFDDSFFDDIVVSFRSPFGFNFGTNNVDDDAPQAEDEDDAEEVENLDDSEVLLENVPLDSTCGITKYDRSFGKFAKIIGGKNADRGRWPWQVALYSSEHEKFFCGGTLITSSWVITAAHCLVSDFGSDFVILAGLYDTDDALESSIHLMKHTVMHPEYDSNTNDNDIALLKLYTEVKLSDDVGVACLPGYLQASPDRSEVCKVLGWGSGTHRTTLQEADMNIQSQRTCRRHHYASGSVITRRMMCASSKNYASDTCGGDSGGPLLCRNPKIPSRPWALFGITSFGDDCTVSQSPGIYTRVSSFRKWIDSTILCDGKC